MCEEEAHDAIVFVPKKDIQFVGFSIYPCLVPDFPPKGDYLDEFNCHWRYKISNERSPERISVFTKDDV
jgi:hypothetical protein